MEIFILIKVNCKQMDIRALISALTTEFGLQFDFTSKYVDMITIDPTTKQPLPQNQQLKDPDETCDWHIEADMSPLDFISDHSKKVLVGMMRRYLKGIMYSHGIKYEKKRV